MIKRKINDAVRSKLGKRLWYTQKTVLPALKLDKTSATGRERTNKIVEISLPRFPKDAIPFPFLLVKTLD